MRMCACEMVWTCLCLFGTQLVGLKDVLEVYEANQFEDLYLVTDLMDTDLHQIIRSKQVSSPFTSHIFPCVCHNCLRYWF